MIGPACSNPVCTEEAAGRILQECGLSATRATGDSCRFIADAPEDPDDPVFMDHYLEMCEIADPNLDADCLATVPCEEFLEPPFPCRNGDSDPISDERLNCVISCDADDFNTCLEGCSDSAAFNACLDCEGSCATAYEDCVDDCPD